MRKILSRLVGTLHLFLGLLQIAFTTWSYFYGEIGLRAFYAEADIDYQTGLYWYTILLIAGSMNFIFAYKLWLVKKERLLILASIVYFFISFFLFFIVGFGKYSNVGMTWYAPQLIHFII